MGELFMKLVNMSITASWLILAVLCVRFLFRKIPRWITCFLWGVVAVRLIFPFSIESVFSLQPSAQPIKSSSIVDGNVVSYVPSVDSNLGFVENVVNPILAETFAYQEAESVAPLQVVTEIAGVIWLCGMVLLLVFAAASMIRLRLSVREAVLYKENIYICDTVRSPFILGIVKPAIYLSSALNEYETDYIVAHEKAHLRRKDHLWKPFGYMLLCVYWFNPLCWIAYMMLCKDIELACDEKVIQDMSFADKKEYSKVLLSCASQRRLVLACPLAFGEVGVKERVKSVLNYKKPAFWITLAAIAVCIIMAICFLTNPKKDLNDEMAEADNRIYENIVAGLGDNEAYAFLDMDYKYMVLLTSDLIYDEGNEKQAAISCDIYYPVDGTAEKLGTIMSDGTAYPITFTKDGIFAASGHQTEKYAISEDGTLYLKKGIYEQFDEAGNARYTAVTNGKESELTEQEYYTEDEYGRSQIVHFSYGADGSVNEYLEVETVLDANDSEIDMEALHGEMERVVSSIGLENAYLWNQAADLESNADALIKMASDETGRFEIYGIMSAKYGTYGLLLNDWIDGEQNWNYAYVPWYYAGEASSQPILEPDGTGKYTFAYIYQYEDGVPMWNECILDCGYDTGHMELRSSNEMVESSAVSGDYEWITEEINVEKKDITHDGVADYIVTSMTYAPEVVDINATLEEKIAQQVMYDIVCVKVYEGSKASDTYSEEKLLWSEEYSRVHAGNGQLSVIQRDGEDYLLASNLWAGQGFAAWEFEVFSLNGKGDKEVIDKQTIEFELQEDNFADEESYANFNQSLKEYIDDGILLVACDIDFEQQLIRTQERQYIPWDYYRNAFVKYNHMEDEPEYDTDNTVQSTKENTEKSATEVAIVDTSKVSSIVAINGNTGERKTFTTEDEAYEDLLKLYTQLDFSAEYEENTRIGYQYSMQLLDADGQKLQSVTPYKDGLTVDDIFYKYDSTGDSAKASLRLMECLELSTQ